MKNRILLFLVFALLSLPSFGTHYIGMTVSYEMVGPNTMRVHQFDYFDCTGVPLNYIDFTTVTGVGSSCTGPVPIGSAVGLTTTEVTPVCPGVITTCTVPGAALYGVVEKHLYRDYDISSATCPDVSLIASTCCRNNSMTNVANAGSSSGVAISTTSLAALQMGNSSPVWDEKPMLMTFSADGAAIFDNSATDPDGDSLVYALTAPQGGSGPLTYSPGFSLALPMGPNWDVSLDSELGLLDIAPAFAATNPYHISAFAVTVYEYRNGVLLGAYTRDMRLVSMVNPALQPVNPPTHTGMQNPQGGILVGDTLVVPANGTFCVDVAGEDVDPGDIALMTSFFAGFQPANFTDTNVTTIGYVLGEDPVGRFCGLTPSMGTFPLLIGLRDDSCGNQGLDVREYTIMVGDTGQVWPGDANNDLVADVNDLLALGLSFGNTGPARAGASNAWTGQFAFPWQDTIVGAIDQKYQDCDGNGTVNQDDTLAIVLNLGLTHTKTTGLAGGPDDPPLVMVIPTDTAYVGDTIHAPIFLGDATHPVQNGYGIAFTINYDASLIDSNSFYITFDNNWMGGPPNSLDLSLNDHLQSSCDAAFVRTDHQAAVGSMGQIATAHFIIIDNIDGKRNLLVADTLGFAFSNVNLIDLNGMEMPTNPSPTEMIVVDNIVEIAAEALGQEILVYPNPAQDWVMVEAGGQLIESIEMVDLQGKTVHQSTNPSERMQLEIKGKASGMYFLRIRTALRTETHKILID